MEKLRMERHPVGQSIGKINIKWGILYADSLFPLILDYLFKYFIKGHFLELMLIVKLAISKQEIVDKYLLKI